jgi:hypothetical protein
MSLSASSVIEPCVANLKNFGPAGSGGPISSQLQGNAVDLQERQPAMVAIGKHHHAR